MAGRIAGLTVEIGGNTTKLQAALKGVDTSLRTMKSGLRDVDRLLKFNPASTTLLTQKQQLLKKSIEETKDRLRTLKDAQKQMDDAGVDKNSDDYQRLQREIEATKQKLQGLKREYNSFASVAGAKMQAIGQSMQDFGKKISAVGDNLTRRVTAPIVALGAVAAKKFAEVDKTMQLTNATMGNTEAEAKLINSAMKEAAANSTFGMNDAATASLNFARAGLNASQAANTLAPAMNLAAGEGGNLDTVSAGLVATINGFHGSFDDAAKYADVFANACNNSALDIDSLSEAMSIAAPIFAAAGYKVEDAALYMGVMANNGIDADKAANSLKTGMARLVKPTDEAAKYMKKLGINIVNSDGSMKDSVQVQKELHDAFSGLSEAEQIAAASAIFGKNQMSPWLALINSAPADVDALSRSLKQEGTTAEMAEAMMSGFGGAMEKLKSSVDVAATSLGEALAPMIRKVSDRIQAAVDWFNNLSEEQKQSIARTMALVAALGPLLAIGGRLITGIGQLISGTGRLFSLIAANPMMALAAAGVAAGAAMYGIYKSGQIATEAQHAFTKEQRESLKAVNEAVDAYNEAAAASDKQSAAVNSEFNYVRELKDEYNSLVDANGKVKEADQERADFILGQLAQSLGMEKSQIQDLIDKNGKLTGSIDKVIQKKEAQAYLDANYDGYVKAIQLQTENNEKLANSLVALNDKQTEAAAAKQKLSDAEKAYNDALRNGSRTASGERTRMENARNNYDAVNKKVKEAESTVKKYADASADASTRIANYENLKTAVQTGNMNKINAAMQVYQTNMKTATSATQQELTAQAKEYDKMYRAVEQAYKDGNKGVTQQQVEAMRSLRDQANKEAGITNKSVGQIAKNVQNASAQANKKAGGSWASLASTISGKMAAAQKSVDNSTGNIKKKFPISVGKAISGYFNLPSITSTLSKVAGAVFPRLTSVLKTIRFAKGYTSPKLFNSPTMYGGAMFGDRGDAYGGEVVYSRRMLMNDIHEAVMAQQGGGNVFNITVDGSENPEAFADRLVRQIQLRQRMA